MTNRKGFTLVELLVVIAIIGILSSVAIVNLNSARRKAHAANVQSALSSLTSAAIVCHDDGLELTTNGTEVCSGQATDIPVGGVGSRICSGSETDWPDITTEDDWAYTVVSAGAGCTSDSSANEWEFRADDNNSARYILCNETGCTAFTSGGF